MTKVKICGLRRAEDVAIVNRLQPDLIGFVCYEKSFRYVDRKLAYELRQQLSANIPAVGVFVSEQIEVIRQLWQDQSIQRIQLHGNEDAAYVQALREAIPDAVIIRAVRVQSGEQILEAQESACDYLLLDTYVKDQYGGSGKSFDLSLIPPLKKPWFLAGGLQAENIREKLRIKHPYGVDVSSAVETNRYKDEEKIRRFLEAVRGA